MIFVLAHPVARQRAQEAVKTAPEGYVVSIWPPKRSAEQNAALWPVLDAFSEQLEWPVNGRMTKLSADEWKDILTAAYRRETARVAAGLDGGVVMLGSRTSVMNRRTFSEFLDFVHATAAARGVDCDRPIAGAVSS